MHIEEVILQTASLSRTRLFYNKTLELPVEKETDEEISFRVGTSLLTFHAVAEGKPYYHIAFNITNNKFSDSFEWVNQKLDILPMENGLPIAAYPDWNAQSFYFFDNNGSILEFIARFDLPYESKEDFSISDIREISEVGIACDHVPETAEWLQSEFSIPYFKKSKASPVFTVMGDDHGLFILSHTGRAWVPVDKPTRKFPITVLADGQRIQFSA